MSASRTPSEPEDAEKAFRLVWNVHRLYTPVTGIAVGMVVLPVLAYVALLRGGLLWLVLIVCACYFVASIVLLARRLRGRPDILWHPDDPVAIGWRARQIHSDFSPLPTGKRRARQRARTTLAWLLSGVFVVATGATVVSFLIGT